MVERVFEKELVAFRSKLFGFAFSLTSNAEDAEDLTQETFLRALKFKTYYETEENFKGWMFTIMRNIFINNYRRKVHYKPISDASENDFYLDMPQESGIINAESSIALSEIYNIISTFEEDYKIPFKLHLDGYKYQEISDGLNVPIGTIKSRIYFARKQLIETLASYEKK